MNQRVDLDREQWAAIRDLFDALAEASPAEREFILAQSRQPASVIAEAKALLAAADGAGAFMEVDAGRLTGAPAAEVQYQSLATGVRVGAFSIVALIGRGGQGEVYQAERWQGGFEQAVALKLLRPEADEQFSRFEYERQVLAGFEHPGIARLVDGGKAPDGRPYLAMEFVAGTAITRHCAEAGLPLAARLDLFEQVCEAVAYAHRNLVVHRDLKPSNVLVTPEGQVKLLDFGVAHALEAPGQTLMTQVVFTPDYAAPEQFEGRNPTTATDVYALGAILFELLTGRPPWQLANSAFAGAMRVMQDQPPLPSRAATERADAPVPPEQLRGDLDVIVQKAMRYEAGERYQNVNDFAEDLGRFRRLEPIAARRGERLYRIRRFLRRNRTPLIAAGLLLAALGAGVTGIVMQMRRTEIARLAGTAENERATALRDGFMLMLRAASQSGGPGFASARQVLDAAAAQLQREGDANAPLLLRTLAELYGEIGDPRTAVRLMERYAEQVRGSAGRLAEAQLALAGYRFQLGERDKAQEALLEAKRFFQTEPARHPKQLAELAGVEAGLLREAGKRPEAMTRLRTAIAELTALFGRDNGEIATLQHNLALHALEAGQIDAATQALDEAERVLAASGRGRSVIAIGVLNLRAALTLRQGDAAGAERLWRQAVERQRRDYGPSLALAAIELNLGRLIMAGSRFSEAMPILEGALGIAAPLAGESNAVTIMLRQSRATGLMVQNRLADAQGEIDQALRAARAAFGERHPYVGIGLGARSQILLARGDPAAAMQALDQAEGVLREAGAAGAPHLAELAPMRTLIEDALRGKSPRQP
ncbi:protein kinase domain-containing protein [Bosea sp. NPDC003192]|uniref:serine/threonine-protein kinase n=1 Tax=Bosea sp. NPDC003192 TaxID=3390551 RepID=UPI003D01C095